MTKRTAPFSPEVRERAVRMVDHQASTARDALDRAKRLLGRDAPELDPASERDWGQQAGPTTDERERIKALERALRQANEPKDRAARSR